MNIIDIRIMFTYLLSWVGGGRVSQAEWCNIHILLTSTEDLYNWLNL